MQLGVVTVEHDAVSKAESLRTVKRAGRDVAVISSDETLADHEISPFVVNMENEGRLSQRGRFRTNDDDLEALLTNHVPVARALWKLGPKEPMDIAIYAHGGLTDEDAAAKTARDWVPHLYTNKIFPIFLMWETGARRTLSNMFQDVTRGEAELSRGRRSVGAVQRAVFGVEGGAPRGARAVSRRQDVGGDEAERGRAFRTRGSGHRQIVRVVQG